jgi:NodT family efflux transporter outer membrane factor (OMF) lipoprotein
VSAPPVATHRRVRPECPSPYRARRRRGALFTSLALTLVLAACALGPNYHRPPAPVPSAYKELPPGWKVSTPQDTKERGPWWSVFDDPELDRLERQVSISNQNVKQYEAEYREAVALLRAAQAQLFPVIAVNGGMQRGGGGGGTSAVSSTVGSGSGGSTHTEFTLEATATWTPDIWGSVRRQIESRRAAVQVSEADLANALLSAQATLAADYFDLRAADSLRTLLERLVGEDRRALDIARNQVNAGTATEADLAEAQAVLLGAQAQLAAVEQQRGTYEHALAMLTGQVPAQLSIAPAPLAAQVPAVPIEIPSTLLERNPAVAAAERQMQSENALIGVAIGAYFPTLNLSALGGYAGNPLAKLIDAGNRIWSLGAMANDTVFQGGAQVAAVAGARATYDQAVASYRQTVLTTFQSVEDQLLALRVLEKEVDLDTQSVQYAQKAVDVAMNEFNAGTVVYTTVITDIQTLIGSEEALLTARQNRIVATITLIEDLGGGWDASQLKP